jgi:phage tail-like protein
MDANGLKFWMLANQTDWRVELVEGLPPNLQYDSNSRLLRLASSRPDPNWLDAESQARGLLESVPQTFDAWGTRAFWSAVDHQVKATGAGPGDVRLFSPTPGDLVTDLALGYDEVLYIATGGHVVLLDPRERFSPYSVPDVVGFQAWRLASDPSGGVWVLDNIHFKIGRVRGLPSIARPHPEYAAGTFRPCQENADPPHLDIQSAFIWPINEQPAAIAVSPEGRIALLSWKDTDAAQLRTWDPNGRPVNHSTLVGARHPYSMTWMSSTMVALLLPGLNEAPVYPADEGASKTLPTGDIYPLRDHDGGPFLHGNILPPRYPRKAGGSGTLYPLSLPSYAREGKAQNAIAIDSGDRFTVWHRLYLEAVIPDHCGVTISVAAVDHPEDNVAEGDWHPHRFGQIFAHDWSAACGAWVPAASEAPFHSGLLKCSREKDRAGLFTALIQRPDRKVRSVRGQYLKVRVQLLGNGRSTPELAAVRAYASRFSYADRYLPELYREDLFGPDADASGPGSGADFLERFLGNFEGILTPLEDKIAGSYLVTTAENAPGEALEWLGSWIGVSFDSTYTDRQRREFLRNAPDLFRRRGTLGGLSLALDIATNGAVTRGQIVVIEDYRLRRTFSTILGADLSDAKDPLVEGLASSGNSFVGETFFLGDELNPEFLALYRDNFPKTKSERAAVESFYDGLANRVTVLVHQEITPVDLGLVRRVVQLETPAHVSAAVKTATNEFLTGVSSLIGVDTYLAKKLGPGTARVDTSYLGRGDLVQREPALDPRLDGEDVPVQDPPIAHAAPVQQIASGESIVLDASHSSAFGDRKIVKYIWTLIE